MLQWQIKEEDFTPYQIQYFDYITTVYLVDKDGYIINHITIGGYPYLPFHHPDYMLIPANTFTGIIGCKLDNNSHDKLVSAYISQKQKNIRDLEHNIQRYDTTEICDHVWHNYIFDIKANLSPEIKADIINHKKNKQVLKSLSLCACRLSNNNIRIIPMHSPEPYCRNEGDEFLGLVDNETAKLINYSADVDWMLSSTIQPLNVNNLFFEVNKEDVERSIEDKEAQIKYYKWIEAQMNTLGRKLQSFI